jgi:TonB family protein
MQNISSQDLTGRVEGAQHALAATAAKEPVRSLRKPPLLNQGSPESSAAPVSITNSTLPGEQPRLANAPPVPWPHEEARLAPTLIPVVSPPRNAEATGSERNSTKNGGEGPSLQKNMESAGRISGTVAITTDPYPSIRFSGQPNGKKSRGRTSLRLGQLVSRVEPAYPEEAMQKGVGGTVKMHVIVSREGSIERLVSVDGPPLLVPATVRAVQQWRYSPTLLAGQPVETEDNVAVTFGLSTGINR